MEKCAASWYHSSMNRRNYRRELDRIIERNGETRPKVLLHSCCGPCSTSVLEDLMRHFDVTVLWYNPNLYPESEYTLRLTTMREMLRIMGLEGKVTLLTEPWRSEEYYAAVRGLEEEPEGGKRCGECFALRMRETARRAKELGFDYFCTTLTVSRHKNAERINAIGERIAAEEKIAWLPSDFKKRGGEDRSQQLSRELGLYQQLYCGCEFSLNKRGPKPDEE